MSDTRSKAEIWNSYAPVVDNFTAPPPAPVEADPVPQNIQVGLIIVVSANLAVMGIVIGGMLWGGMHPAQAVISGVIYFSVTTPLYLAIVTGVLTAVLGRREREKTERLRIQAYQELGQQAIAWRHAVENNRTLELQTQALPSQLTKRIAALELELMERRDNAGGVQTPSTFVSPYDNRSQAAFAEETQPATDTTADEALAWARNLFDEYGEVDRGKVNSDGRLRVRMIGSSRGPGTREAGLWLINKGVIRKVPGGFALNLAHYSTRERLRDLR